MGRVLWVAHYPPREAFAAKPSPKNRDPAHVGRVPILALTGVHAEGTQGVGQKNRDPTDVRRVPILAFGSDHGICAVTTEAVVTNWSTKGG